MGMISKERKGDISIEVLIWAALGLLVLIFLIFIFMGKINFFNMNTPDDCKGSCIKATEDCPSSGMLRVYTKDCPDVEEGETKVKQVCCQALG
ncbi:MAG: hypothetical protein QS98_C0006G0029 [archaeon GW2011_AR3]|nr:MAG: hypothetical protein QS98_C0006G0029 [archaeon GW2011_AR3]MBS3109210.1 hypothetical protein [Candidatus Woesearchaeota archaeon]